MNHNPLEHLTPQQIAALAGGGPPQQNITLNALQPHQALYLVAGSIYVARAAKGVPCDLESDFHAAEAAREAVHAAGRLLLEVQKQWPALSREINETAERLKAEAVEAQRAAQRVALVRE